MPKRKILCIKRNGWRCGKNASSEELELICRKQPVTAVAGVHRLPRRRQNSRGYVADLILYCQIAGLYDTGEGTELNDRVDQQGEDFMGMFDFDGNGHMDSGEHFIGYQIFKDVTGSGSSGSGSSGGSRRGGLDGFTVFIIVLFVFWLLNQICSLLY